MLVKKFDILLRHKISLNDMPFGDNYRWNAHRTVQLSFLIFLLWLMSRKKKNGRFPYIKERKGADKTDIKIKINKTITITKTKTSTSTCKFSNFFK